MKKLDTSGWFVLSSMFAFISFICFISVDSAVSEEYHLNTEFTVGGFTSLILAAFSMYKARDLRNNV